MLVKACSVIREMFKRWILAFSTKFLLRYRLTVVLVAVLLCVLFLLCSTIWALLRGYRNFLAAFHAFLQKTFRRMPRGSVIYNCNSTVFAS